jgi:hypothetical protein
MTPGSQRNHRTRRLSGFASGPSWGIDVSGRMASHFTVHAPNMM